MEKNGITAGAGWGEGSTGSVRLAKLADIRHLIEYGALIYTWLDLETTDKDWKTAEITTASLKITDLAYNLVSNDFLDVRVPDRVGLSPEAMLVTGYRAEDLRDPARLPPQQAAAMIYEAVQDAPRRLWDALGKWKDKLGEEKYRELVDERIISVPGRTGKPHDVRVRHYPALDDNGNVLRAVRIHEPSSQREFMQMSCLAGKGEPFDYEDEAGRWKVRQLDKFNYGFRNTFFDNRLMAAALFRANFPLKQIYAMNRKRLGNHAADVFSMALMHHFFSTKGRDKVKLGTRIEPETSREKISAKLDLIMDENQRRRDRDVGVTEGTRVGDGTLHNEKRGHNSPDYDNEKSIGLHRYIRETDPELAAHLERCGKVDWFRDFLTRDTEGGVPTTHPVRFAITSANDDEIYRAVPLIILGSDDEHGKFNRVWGMRADINYETYQVDGKRLVDMDTEELSSLIRAQRGQPGAIFHEIHLKRFYGVTDAETGLKAGHAPGHSLESLRYVRDYVCEHLDEKDRPFIDKAMNAFYMQRPAFQMTDEVPQPYVEEEIWSAMGDAKYVYVELENGQTVKLPNVLRELIQDEFKRVNDRVGDTLRELVRPQKLEWDASDENALAYVRLREKMAKKLEQYQANLKPSERISLPGALYPDSREGALDVPGVYSTVLQDRLFLMDKIQDAILVPEIQQRIDGDGGPAWQRVPFEELARMGEARITGLRDSGRLRVRFEDNPNHPSFRFAIRNFVEAGMEDLLPRPHLDFYKAETAIYTAGPPYIDDPEKHRVMTAPKIRHSLEKLRQNIKPGKQEKPASRTGELGAYELYADDDLAEAIIRSVEADTARREKTYGLTPKRLETFGIDAETRRPRPHIRYEIPHKHLIVKVPDGSLATPASHPSLGHTCIVVPDVKKLPKARHIILEEENTGRRFYAAESVVSKLPPRTQGSYDEFYAAAENAWEAGGRTLPEKGFVVSCAELVPLSTLAEPRTPAIKVANDRLMATRAPRLGRIGRDEPVSVFAVRKYDQNLADKQKIRLRGVGETGGETGWEAETRIKGEPVEMTLKEFLGMLDDPARQKEADTLAFAAGYNTAADMKAGMLREFTRFDENVMGEDKKLLFFEVEPPKRIVYWTPKQPRAAFESKAEGRANTPARPAPPKPQRTNDPGFEPG